MPTVTLEGKQIPDVTFKVMDPQGQWQDWKIRDLCKGKTVVIFSLPGAFTPTCSSQHLPRYEELYTSLRKAGIDEIYCLSVNDTFVMNSWALTQDVSQVKMLPDGNGTFTEAVGLLVDKSAVGLGKRSWRYSMLVKDNTIAKVFVEPEEGADPFGVSDADTMLKFVDPDVKAPPQIAMLTKKGCMFCEKAKGILGSKGLRFVEICLPDATRGQAVGAMTAKSAVPQIWINGHYVGGSEELQKWFASNPTN